MPKVGHKQFLINGFNTNIEIWYKRDKGFFQRGIPNRVLNFARDKNLKPGYYETENKLISSINRVLDLYHKEVCKITKVIIFRCGFGVYDIFSENAAGGYYHNGEAYRMAEQIKMNNAIGFEFDIFHKIEAEETKYFHLRHGSGSNPAAEYRPGKYDQIIEWSEGAERFFKRIQKEIEQAAVNMAFQLEARNLKYIINESNKKKAKSWKIFV